MPELHNGWGGLTRSSTEEDRAAPLVLLVSDASSPAGTCCALALIEFGFLIARVGSVEAGVTATRVLCPDIVIVDLAPTKAVSELCLRLRADGRTRVVPVAWLAPQPAWAVSLEPLCDDLVVVSSSCSPDELLSALVHFLEQPASSSQAAAHRQRLRHRFPSLAPPRLRLKPDRRKSSGCDRTRGRAAIGDARVS